MLNLTMLGTGGGMPIPKRHLSSCMINYKGRKLLIDAGEGTQVAMRKFHTGFRSLDVICITHFHGDHIFGLPGLFSTLNNSDRIEPITIVGPIGLKKIIRGILTLVGSLNFDLELIEDPKEDLYFTLSDDILKPGKGGKQTNTDIIISTMYLDHSSPCFGYRFKIPRNPKFYPEEAIKRDIPKEFWSRLQEGKTIENKGETYKPDMVLGSSREGIVFSYITDTRPMAEIEGFIRDSDLLVCEGTYGENEHREKAREYYHMTFKEAAELALGGKVKKLLLTHFSVRLEDPKEFKGNALDTFKDTIIAYDGYRISLSYKD